MLGNSIATFVRVKPAPRTLAESSAVFRNLKQYGQVTSFIKGPVYLAQPHSQLYYAVLANTSPTLNSPVKFDVPVYHNLPDPKDEDPFDIRGLQDRKPYPQPVTFACTMERIDDQERRKQVESYFRSNNPYTEEFRTAWEECDDTQTVLRDMKAPLPAIRGLGRLVARRKGRGMVLVAAEKAKSKSRRATRPTPPAYMNADEDSVKPDLDLSQPNFEPISASISGNTPDRLASRKAESDTSLEPSKKSFKSKR